jgi:ribulose-phosphate 3-epimerase
MSSILPTVTAENEHQYREQIERIAPFATSVHLDFMDGTLTDTHSPELSQAWWPHTMQADLHLMFKNPTEHLDTIIPLNPRLVIVHAEAAGDLVAFAGALHQAGIQFGLALLPGTPAEVIRAHAAILDHVLIFSGDLGHFGGTANLDLLNKITEVKAIKSSLAIGWDGGINTDNAAALAEGDVDALNVGGFIQYAQDPLKAYQELQKLVQ